jgi:hypothetical protein
MDDRVRLTCDVPQLFLTRGDVGMVRSIWLLPDGTFEVEFHLRKSGEEVRALLKAEQIEPFALEEFDKDKPTIY